jgi:hypothetical protein
MDRHLIKYENKEILQNTPYVPQTEYLMLYMRLELRNSTLFEF